MVQIFKYILVVLTFMSLLIRILGKSENSQITPEVLQFNSYFQWIIMVVATLWWIFEKKQESSEE